MCLTHVNIMCWVYVCDVGYLQNVDVEVLESFNCNAISEILLPWKFCNKQSPAENENKG